MDEREAERAFACYFENNLAYVLRGLCGASWESERRGIARGK